MPLPVPGKIKGVFLAHLAQYLEEAHGPEAVDRVALAVSATAAAALRARYGFEWYPMADAVELERAVVDLFFQGDIRQAERIGRYDLRTSLNTVYRLLFRLLDPDTLILRSGRLWSQYYDQGRVEATKVGPRNCAVRVLDFNPVQRTHCHEMSGGLYGALEVTGVGTGAVEHRECVLDGKPACVFDVRW